MSTTKVSAALMESGTKGADIASAGTMVIGTDGGYFDITGTTGISTMTVAAGRVFTLQFDGVVTLTHSSTLYLSGAADFTTEANDHMTFISVAANDVRQIGTGLKDGGSPVAVSTITKSSSNPVVTTNPSGGVGTIFLNTSTGEMYCCTDATTNANVWINIGEGEDSIGTSYAIDWLVIAGGGGGGGSSVNGGGGGGAGGYRTSYGAGSISGGLSAVEADLTLVPNTVYTITIGSGGGAGAQGSNGATSSITGSDITDITTVGGGGGGNNSAGGVAGGSGGGHGRDGGTSSAAAGTANQGFAGGVAGGTVAASGGGGGGAGQVGYAGTSPDGAGDPYNTGQTPANGGDGIASSITGSAVTRAGGGGGSWENGAGAGQSPPGGAGGGGRGSTTAGTANATTAGTVNTGSGGGGGQGSSYTGSAGGSGVVILRMLTADYSSTTTGSPTVSTSGSDTILIYTGTGSYTA